MSVGDRLARGDKSANFSVQSTLSDFGNDLLFNEDEVAEKYGLTPYEVEEWQQRRLAGDTIPDLETAAVLAEKKSSKEKLGFTVTDKRFLLSSLGQAAPVEERKFPEPVYASLTPILDRILVMRVTPDKNLEIQEDGSVVNKTSGIAMPAKYRQHSNTAVVLKTGDFVIVGGQKIPMDEVVRPGDRVTYGDYNSEVFLLSEKLTRQLCDEVKVNYEKDPQGLRIVRVQDVRGVERPVEVKSE